MRKGGHSRRGLPAPLPQSGEKGGEARGFWRNSRPSSRRVLTKEAELPPTSPTPSPLTAKGPSGRSCRKGRRRWWRRSGSLPPARRPLRGPGSGTSLLGRLPSRGGGGDRPEPDEPGAETRPQGPDRRRGAWGGEPGGHPPGKPLWPLLRPGPLQPAREHHRGERGLQLRGPTA